MKPGIYYNMSREEYDAIEAVNPSLIKLLLNSKRDAGDVLSGRKRIETDAMKIGTLCDNLLFSADEFDSIYRVWSGGSKNSKEYKTFKEQCAADGVIPIDEDDRAHAINTCTWIRDHKLAGKILSSGKPQACIIWNEKLYGIKCKGLADWIDEDNDQIADLKTVGVSWNMHKIGQQAAHLGYHISMAAYADGYEIVTGRRPKVGLIYVQKKAVTTSGRLKVMYSPLGYRELDRGLEKFCEGLRILDECKKSNDFSDDWDNNPQPLILPEYAYTDGDVIELTLNGETYEQ